MRTFRFFAALMMAVVCVSLSSCSKDDDEKLGSTDDLVGKWELTWTKGWEIDSDGTKDEWDEAESGQLFIFKNDGTGYETWNDVDKYPYTWKLNGNKLTLTYDGYEDAYQVETLNKSTLKMTISDDDESDTSTYKKVAN
ncbi:lipocalin family protein [uncultured Bacteroides sp.]|uniref:lipocalin family protein n=1 Tax=uncultured Bacteroides sp. TaxID=162156 RepID=UPI002598E5AA|nr:lipocalin family protein [uncultured Bacteroides sp.]